MPLVPAKCPECGGNVVVDSGKDAWICDFCKTPFIVETAINNYNTYNQNTYNIENAEIHVTEKSDEEHLNSAEIFLTKIGNKNEARRIFEEVSKRSPQNYKSWWGLARIETNDFEFNETYLDNYKQGKKYAENAMAVADRDVAIELKEKWNSFVYDLKQYKERLSLQLEQKKKSEIELDNIIKNLKLDILECEKKIKDTSDKINQLEKLIKEKKNISIGGNMVAGSIIAFFAWLIIGGIIKVSTIGDTPVVDMLFWIILCVFILGGISTFIVWRQNTARQKLIDNYVIETTQYSDCLSSTILELEKSNASYNQVLEELADLNEKIENTDSIIN